MLRNILSLIALGETVSGISLTRKFVASLLVMIALTILGTIIASALTMFGLFEFYVMLTRHGLDIDMAALFTSSVALLILGIIVFCVVSKVRQIQSLPLNVSTLGSTGLSSLQGLWRGFQRGFTDTPPS